VFILVLAGCGENPSPIPKYSCPGDTLEKQTEFYLNCIIAAKTNTHVLQSNSFAGYSYECLNAKNKMFCSIEEESLEDLE
jgi:hypothetical protein